MPDTHIGETPPAPEPSEPQSTQPPSDSGGGEETHLNIAEMMVGTAMIFVGFIDVLISISAGTEMDSLALIIYFAGLAVWAHARVDNVTVRYVVITLCFVAAAGFFHYGEVHFWHKQLIFWGTILMAIYFMFSTAKAKKAL